MVEALKRAQTAAREAIEELYYTGTCTVIEYQDVTDEEMGTTYQEEVTVLKDQPCKISFESVTSAAPTDTASNISQGVQLFIAPNITIKAGSKVVVNQNEIQGVYYASGEPAVYATHQEIKLELFRGWA